MKFKKAQANQASDLENSQKMATIQPSLGEKIMATQYVPLSPVDLHAEELQIEKPTETPELVYIDDPASYGVIDFAHEEAIMVKEDDSISKISNTSRKTGAHDLLVVDSEERLCGILHSADLQGVRPTQIMESKHIEKNEITASMLMTSLNDVLCLNYDEILHARIGNLVASLNQQRCEYILAIDSQKDSGQQTVRGLVSRWRLNSQLGEDISKYS
jgi:hypothetical protein